mmetsp:Transcript_121868/g.389734  ORF Transcript_121868/g.389734 Transcript_121868/m.389734 type:complete len:205 (-) Transcript_121868:850-1464(-)
MTFSRSVALITMGSCATSTRDGPAVETPSPSVAQRLMAPVTADKRLLLPEPRGPTTAQSSPRGTCMSMDLSVGGASASKPQRKSSHRMSNAVFSASLAAKGGRGIAFTSGCSNKIPTRPVTENSMFKAPSNPPKKANGKYMKRATAKTAKVSGPFGKRPSMARCNESTIAAVVRGTVAAIGHEEAKLIFIFLSALISFSRYCMT